jgi:Uncharacterized protein conserved in bacteria (DUF2252)
MWKLRPADEEHESLDAGAAHDRDTIQLLGGRLWVAVVAGARAVGDVARIEGYCGDDSTLDRALADFADDCGDQTEPDHAELVRAIKRGRVKAIGE